MSNRYLAQFAVQALAGLSDAQEQTEAQLQATQQQNATLVQELSLAKNEIQELKSQLDSNEGAAAKTNGTSALEGEEASPKVRKAKSPLKSV